GAKGGEQGPRLLGSQGRLGQFDQVTVEAQGGRITGDEVQVAGPAVHCLGQPCMNFIRQVGRRERQVSHGAAFAAPRALGVDLSSGLNPSPLRWFLASSLPLVEADRLAGRWRAPASSAAGASCGRPLRTGPGTGRRGWQHNFSPEERIPYLLCRGHYNP